MMETMLALIPVTFLDVLSVVAFFTTVGLFFCGIPICRQIWKRNGTKEISGAPFLMGVLGGVCWFSYGYLKSEKTVLYVTSVQFTLYFTFTMFYWFMTKEKFWISVKVLVLLLICGTIGSLAYFLEQKVYHPLGILCMTLNAADFGAPLGGINTVIRRRATSTLPLPLCIANFLVSGEWFLYGILVWDFYLIAPNGVGFLLATGQLLLFVVLPRKPGKRPPYSVMLEPVKKIHSRIVQENELEVDLYIIEKGFPKEVRKSVDANDAYKQLIHSYFYFTDKSPMAIEFEEENSSPTERRKPLIRPPNDSRQSSIVYVEVSSDAQTEEENDSKASETEDSETACLIENSEDTGSGEKNESSQEDQTPSSDVHIV